MENRSIAIEKVLSRTLVEEAVGEFLEQKFGKENLSPSILKELIGLLTSKEKVADIDQKVASLLGRQVEFGDDDSARLDRIQASIMAKVPKLVEDVTDKLASQELQNFVRYWGQERGRLDDYAPGFRRRLRLRWGRGLDALDMLLGYSRALGDEALRSSRRRRTERQLNLENVAFRMHSRACQVLSEILVLLENGFADGAIARWRTLHEISIVLLVISEGGEELAKRFLRHDAFEAKQALKRYDECHVSLGYPAITTSDRLAVENACQLAVQDFGKDFLKKNGWASSHLKKTAVEFADLEAAAGNAMMGLHFKNASYRVHADIAGLNHRLGVLGPADLHLAGASNAGLHEPGQLSAISISKVAVALAFGKTDDIDFVVKMKAMIALRDRAVSAFVAAGTKLKKDARRVRRRK